MCSRLLGEVGAFLDERFTSAHSPTHSIPQKQLPEKGSVDQQANQESDPVQCDKMNAKSIPLPTKALWNYVQVMHKNYSFLRLREAETLSPHSNEGLVYKL